MNEGIDSQQKVDFPPQIEELLNSKFPIQRHTSPNQSSRVGGFYSGSSGSFSHGSARANNYH